MFSSEPLTTASPHRRILVVDDHALVRMCVVRMCASLSSELEVLEAPSLAAALDVYDRYADSVELVLLELNLPDSKGFASLLTLKRRHPRSRIMVLSGAVDEAIAAEARFLGAEKFLDKSGDPALLRAALSDFVNLLEPARRQTGWAKPARRSSEPSAPTLSAREIEILDLVLQGKNNQEIVAKTGLRLGTVKNYLSGLFALFGVPSRSRLVTLFG
ncbi:response regulator transcription factor [Ramlibacter henchirensis]|uniref:Response regulator transcription factor n=1 Tax=Ramlibacter henchirensis TaxID=204072 RepID=A0A4Z0C6K0_9BURK|nr:response regulator transcription factor [Ramlibacter henchirensis]TFZ06512.1 response regulator transcription factor [Ramlibacter henchirensis]